MAGLRTLQRTVIYGFAERIYTGYTSLGRKKWTSYVVLLHAVLCDPQYRGEYLGTYKVYIGEGHHSFHLGHPSSDGKRGKDIPPSEGDAYVTESSHHRVLPSSFTFLSLLSACLTIKLRSWHLPLLFLGSIIGVVRLSC